MRRARGVALALVPLAAGIATLTFSSPWRTPDQAGMASFRRGDFAQAALRFESAEWRAAALYRDGEFEAAASLLSGVAGADAAHNRGNAQVFLGRYEDAVESYARALELRPGWKEAEANRRIAASRIRVAQVGEATMLGADDVVFDDSGDERGESVEVTGGDELSEDALRELWLRSVETRPADFLRTKFATQRAAQGREQERE